jgi:hypothetical protein
MVCFWIEYMLVSMMGTAITVWQRHPGLFSFTQISPVIKMTLRKVYLKDHFWLK